MLESRQSSDTSAKQWRWVKAVVGGLAVALAWTLYLRFGDLLTLEQLAAREAELRAAAEHNPLMVYASAFAIYVLVTGLSLPGATALTLVYAWYFGWLPTVILVSFASTAGATAAFLLSRFLFRSAVEHYFARWLTRFDRAWQREGPFFLFTLRLVPAVPFFVINLVMGVTPIRARTFWWVSQLGMFPATVIYAYAGSSVPSLEALAHHGVRAVFTPTQLTRLTVALTLLGLFPLAARWMVRAMRPPAPASGERLPKD